MRIPESWLREFCNPPLSTQELAETLTMGGFEVEEIALTAPEFTKVVIGEIIAVEPHPNADRLRVCSVAAGAEQPLQIVCGAPNARVGIKVPCALIGAQLPTADAAKPFSIKLGKLRGVESFGMLCAANELGILGEYPDGLLELAQDAAVGTDIRSYLNLDDAIFTLKLTPNLAHALSVYGVARELAALTGAELKTPAVPQLPAQQQDKLPVTIVDKELCSRFSGRIMTEVNAQVATPDWMLRRLLQCGQRGVNVLADISNYALLEYGQPTHFFDLTKINQGLQIRWAKAGEKCLLLNGKEVELSTDMAVVADQQPLAIAGIMGGELSAVTTATKAVYLEAANWQVPVIAGRSRKLNFSTESSHRFERGVDPELTVSTIERISAMVAEICGAKLSVIDDQLTSQTEPTKVSFRASRASKVIGMPLSQAQCAAIFEKLGFAVVVVAADQLSVTAPSYRFDIHIEEDLIEEVIRIIGYNNMPQVTPQAALQSKVRSETKRSSYDVRYALADFGYQEVINYSFVQERWEQELAGNQEPIKVMNPISSNMTVMRSSLLGGLVNALKYNLDRKSERLKLFEIGRVFFKDASIKDSNTSVAGFCQPLRVSGIAYGNAQAFGWQAAKRWVDFFDVKGDIERLLPQLALTFKAAQHPALHPGRCAEVFVGQQKIGVLGELHPNWLQAYELAKPAVLFELDLTAVLNRGLPDYQPISSYQPVFRDLAIVVAEQVTYDQVVNCIMQHKAVPLLKDVQLFDVYRPKVEDGSSSAEKSLAIRLTISSSENTLNEEQIETTVQTVLKLLQADLNAKLRS